MRHPSRVRFSSRAARAAVVRKADAGLGTEGARDVRRVGEAGRLGDLGDAPRKVFVPPFHLEKRAPGWHTSSMTVHEKYRKNAATTAVLMEAGIALMRQNIRRSHPAMLPEQAEEMLSSWLWRVGDPVPGDTAGAVHVRERKP